MGREEGTDTPTDALMVWGVGRVAVWSVGRGGEEGWFGGGLEERERGNRHTHRRINGLGCWEEEGWLFGSLGREEVWFGAEREEKGRWFGRVVWVWFWEVAELTAYELLPGGWENKIHI